MVQMRVLMALAALLPGLAAAGGNSVSAVSKALKVGMVTTLSGSAAPLGSDQRDGFALALKTLGGRLGGVAAQFVVVDDEQQPELARRASARLLRPGAVDFLTGITSSKALLAVVPMLAKSRTFYVSAAAAPARLAGEQCSPYFFSVAAQDDAEHEAMGKYLAGKSMRSVAVVTGADPDPAQGSGGSAFAAFTRYFPGASATPISVDPAASDYSAQLAQLRARRPAAVYLALPGSAVAAFVRQFVAAGLSGEVQLFAAGTSADEDVIRTLGATLLGTFNAAPWAHDLENSANARFVADFERAYGRLPSLYAAQAYDAAMLIDSAVRETRGRLGDKQALRRALEAARFKSVRGDFAFGVNHYPLSNVYLRVVGRDARERVTNKTMGTLLARHADAYVGQCALR